MILGLILLFQFLKPSYGNECWNNPLFSSKTPYKLVGNMNLDVKYPDGCKPVQINLVHRHGHRYPSRKNIIEFNDMFDILKSSHQASSKDFPTENPFTVDQDKLLTVVGEEEMYGIAQRIRQRFPELFTQSYSSVFHKFESSCKSRCLHSSSAFAYGLFEGTGALGECRFQPVAVRTRPCDVDMVLRFFQLCHKYVAEVEENKSAVTEMKKFGLGDEVQLVINKMMRKLALPKIDIKLLKSMFLFCAYEIGIFNGSTNSGLCSLFDKDDLQILEYYLDLKHYYRRFSAFPITYKSSCPLLADIVKHMKKAYLNTTESLGGIFRSSHAETIMPFIALLGLNKDSVELRADNFNEMKSREFRPSCISPFSGNVYFVLYDCGSKKHKIQLYMNEYLVKIPCCESKYECDFETFLKCYESIVDNCNFNEICSLKKTEL
ncbi:multiple inositol polyphosphate phosphatase 1 [Hydra vulgaris]|uniref:Multiple inositol polyphosphate phosphatase 1 n=1 Tax=Hydra vulgaris TaxID=6087 RepID=A0ABM4D2S7_HYDVU